jgi:hypothetical protein
MVRAPLFAAAVNSPPLLGSIVFALLFWLVSIGCVSLPPAAISNNTAHGSAAH